MIQQLGKVIVVSTVWLALAAPLAAQTHHHHDHGVIRLDVAAEGQTINVFLESPLDSFVGFERAPRTEVEKKRAADALAALRSGSLLEPNREAQCTLGSTEVKAPVLEGQAREKNGHADLEATYVFNCNQPDKLTAINTRFFEKFKHTKKVEAQVVGPKGQNKASLNKNNTLIRLN